MAAPGAMAWAISASSTSSPLANQGAVVGASSSTKLSDGAGRPKALS
jgi:hypothetical protein